MSCNSRTKEPLWHYFSLIFYIALYLLFLFPVIMGSKGFLHGDYEIQFYPWMKFYAENLFKGKMVFWTSLVQCGFPIFAEGQTAFFYPINYILFKLLPFNTAYNWLFLIHLLLSSVGFFLFLKKKGASIIASSFGLLAFSFGSAYAGCFYGIFSLRTLAWFPWLLYFSECYFKKQKAVYILILSMILGVATLSGNPQMCIYVFGFFSCYWIICSFNQIKRFDVNLFRRLILLSFLLLSAVLIGFSQLWASFEAGLSSTRSLQDPKFIFWGSSAPWSFITLFFYSWSSFLKSLVYIGIFPIIFCFINPNFKKYWVFWVLLLIAVLMSLGMFNPIYWLLIHVPGASLFRNPSKFLFFVIFFLSTLSAFSFDGILKSIRKGEFESKRKIYIKRTFIFTALLFGVQILAWCISRFGEVILTKFGQWYVQVFVAGKSFHRHSLEYYQLKIQSLLEIIESGVSIASIDTWIPFFLALLMGILIWCLKNKVKILTFSFCCLLLLSIDLHHFTSHGHGSGFIGNLRAFPSIEKYRQYPKDKKWLDLTNINQAIFPGNRNMLTEHMSVGVYSPLADKHYYQLMSDFGVSDDGFGVKSPDISVLEQNGLLDLVGAYYLIVPKSWEINDDLGFDFYSEEKHGAIYKNKHAIKDFYIVGTSNNFETPKELISYIKSGNFNPRKEVLFLKGEKQNQNTKPNFEISVLRRESEFIELRVTSSADGYLLWNELYDSNWQAYLDGVSVPILRSNHAFQSIRISKGKSNVIFQYEPTFLRQGAYSLLFGLFFLIILLITHRYYKIRD